ncbi:MAG: hypothetical protein ABSB54_18390 [Acidimicrobiales bacterium]
MTGTVFEALLLPLVISSTAQLKQNYDSARLYRYVPIPGFSSLTSAVD